MKKLISLLSLIAMMFVVVPVGAVAKSSSSAGTMYGTINVEESDWIQKSDKSGYYITQKYTVTKTNASGYVYIAFLETLNVKITQVVDDGAFEIVGDYVTTQQDGYNARVYVFKLRSGTSINKETELATVMAEIVDPNNKNCNLSYAPLSTQCSNVNGKYFDNNGKLVTEDEYKAACEGTNPVNPSNPDDEPNNKPDNPQTGNVVPYIAIAGGLAAIAGVYFISKKSNKIYKI